MAVVLLCTSGDAGGDDDEPLFQLSQGGGEVGADGTLDPRQRIDYLGESLQFRMAVDSYCTSPASLFAVGPSIDSHIVDILDGLQATGFVRLGRREDRNPLSALFGDTSNLQAAAASPIPAPTEGVVIRSIKQLFQRMKTESESTGHAFSVRMGFCCFVRTPQQPTDLLKNLKQNVPPELEWGDVEGTMPGRYVYVTEARDVVRTLHKIFTAPTFTPVMHRLTCCLHFLVLKTPQGVPPAEAGTARVGHVVFADVHPDHTQAAQRALSPVIEKLKADKVGGAARMTPIRGFAGMPLSPRGGVPMSPGRDSDGVLGRCLGLLQTMQRSRLVLLGMVKRSGPLSQAEQVHTDTVLRMLADAERAGPVTPSAASALPEHQSHSSTVTAPLPGLLARSPSRSPVPASIGTPVPLGASAWRPARTSMDAPSPLAASRHKAPSHPRDPTASLAAPIPFTTAADYRPALSLPAAVTPTGASSNPFARPAFAGAYPGGSFVPQPTTQQPLFGSVAGGAGGADALPPRQMSPSISKYDAPAVTVAAPAPALVQPPPEPAAALVPVDTNPLTTRAHSPMRRLQPVVPSVPVRAETQTDSSTALARVEADALRRELDTTKRELVAERKRIETEGAAWRERLAQIERDHIVRLDSLHTQLGRAVAHPAAGDVPRADVVERIVTLEQQLAQGELRREEAVMKGRAATAAAEDLKTQVAGLRAAVGELESRLQSEAAARDGSSAEHSRLQRMHQQTATELFAYKNSAQSFEMDLRLARGEVDALRAQVVETTLELESERAVTRRLQVQQEHQRVIEMNRVEERECADRARLWADYLEGAMFLTMTSLRWMHLRQSSLPYATPRPGVAPSPLHQRAGQSHDIYALREKLSQRDAQLYAKTAEALSLEQELLGLRERMTAEHGALERRYASVIERNKALEGEHGAVQAERQQHHGEVRRAQAHAQQAEADKMAVNDELRMLKAQHTAQKASLEEVTRLHEQAVQEAEHARRAQRESQAASEQEIMRLVAEQQQREGQVERMRAQIAELQHVADLHHTCEQQRQALETALEQEQRQVQRYDAENRELGHKVVARNLAAEAGRGDAMRFETQNGVLTRNLEELRRELARVKADNEKLESERRSTTAWGQTLQEEIVAKTQLVDGIERILQEEQQKDAAREHEIAKLREELLVRQKETLAMQHRLARYEGVAGDKTTAPVPPPSLTANTATLSSAAAAPAADTAAAPPAASAISYPPATAATPTQNGLSRDMSPSFPASQPPAPAAAANATPAPASVPVVVPASRNVAPVPAMDVARDVRGVSVPGSVGERSEAVAAAAAYATHAPSANGSASVLDRALAMTDAAVINAARAAVAAAEGSTVKPSGTVGGAGGYFSSTAPPRDTLPPPTIVRAEMQIAKMKQDLAAMPVLPPPRPVVTSVGNTAATSAMGAAYASLSVPNVSPRRI